MQELFPHKKILACLCSISILLIVSCEEKKDVINTNNKAIIPFTEEKPPALNNQTPQRIVDLSKIVIALEKYKIDHHQYPISSKKGNDWDGIYSKYGEGKENWIEGLVPTYIDSLPRDPRMHSSDVAQYMYKSNGANYKLIAHGANDCKEIKALYPSLIDPTRDCFAYGFWTPKARPW